MDEYDIKRQRRREYIKRKRRRQRAVIIACMLLSFVVIIGAILGVHSARQKKEAEAKAAKEKIEQELQEKQQKQAGDLLEACYQSHFEEDAGSFSGWFLEYQPDTVIEKLLEVSADGVLTDAELYEAAGESIYVLADRYHGLLKDAQTAASNEIYMRDGKEEDQVEITIAGDLCLAEDGFVLDYYDTVNDLEQCISPEILEITNGSDIFYVNHEYCISDTGSPLEGKYYTFRANPERMELLKQMGTDIVSLANNHVFDYGKKALLDTTDLLEEAGIPYVGGGRNIEEAKRPIYFIVNGIKIGFVGASNGEKIQFTPQATEEEPGILRAYYRI